MTNYKIVSSIRQELASKPDIHSLQEVLAEHWKFYLENLHVYMADATCYESHIRFPADMKLLWESVEWLYQHFCKQCCELHVRRFRNKYHDINRAYLSYSKKRKRRQSHTRMLKRRLLHLLAKLLGQIDDLYHGYSARLRFTADYQKHLSVIRKVVLQQQKELFAGKKVCDRIVSVDRHYIRPIVRGKETKTVELGVKVNNIQIDGISLY